MELSKTLKIGLAIWFVALAIIAVASIVPTLVWLAFLGGLLAGVAGFFLGIDVVQGGATSDDS